LVDGYDEVVETGVLVLIEVVSDLLGTTGESLSLAGFIQHFSVQNER
jgi:hypothetical protein